MLRATLSRYVQLGGTGNIGSLSDAREVLVGESKEPAQAARSRYTWKLDREIESLQSQVRQLQRAVNDRLRKNEDSDVMVDANLRRLQSHIPAGELQCLPRILAIQQLDTSVDEMNQELYRLRSQKVDLERRIDRERERQQNQLAMIQALKLECSELQAIEVEYPQSAEDRQGDGNLDRITELGLTLRGRIGDIKYLVGEVAKKLTGTHSSLKTGVTPAELQDLLEQLLNNLMETPSGYYEISDPTHPIVRFLIELHVVVCDPSDPNRIRLRDLSS